MPMRDGSGPRGLGRQGRGLGPCGLGRRNDTQGQGGGYRWRALAPPDASQEQDALGRRVAALEAELIELRGRRAEAPKPPQE